MTLEEFMTLPTCESPRGARLFAQHEEVLRYNMALKKRIREGARNPGTPKESPIAVFRNWYRRPGNRPGTNARFSFFRLKNQVLLTGQDGAQNAVYKHYGVAQRPTSVTRQPHNLFWSGYLGTDQAKAHQGMLKMLEKA